MDSGTAARIMEAGSYGFVGNSGPLHKASSGQYPHYFSGFFLHLVESSCNPLTRCLSLFRLSVAETCQRLQYLQPEYLFT